MKILAFELAAGRKVDMLPECESLIEELKASHSTDLQQRAYELQAHIISDSHAAGSAMPSDASCEDIEVDENLTFLDNYIKQSLEKGAQPYIPESQRSGMLNTSNFRGPSNHEASTHTLKFEAYELTKVPVQTTKTPVPHMLSTELVPVPESSYNKEIHQATSSGSVAADLGSNGVRLKLDGVQKKWGRPTHSSSSSASSSTSNGGPSHERGSNISYDLKKQQVEISQEKQKLAASLFGGISKDERASSFGHKPTKSAVHKLAMSHKESSVTTPNEEAAGEERTTPAPPLPDLLDVGEPQNKDTPTSVDPIEQLEGLLEAPGASLSSSGVAKEPGIMGLYGDMANSDPRPSTYTVASQAQKKNKGPNPKDSLQKDALVRQMGVTPTSQNPNLFMDLLG